MLIVFPMTATAGQPYCSDPRMILQSVINSIDRGSCIIVEMGESPEIDHGGMTKARVSNQQEDPPNGGPVRLECGDDNDTHWSVAGRSEVRQLPSSGPASHLIFLHYTMRSSSLSFQMLRCCRVALPSHHHHHHHLSIGLEIKFIISTRPTFAMHL